MLKKSSSSLNDFILEKRLSLLFLAACVLDVSRLTVSLINSSKAPFTVAANVSPPHKPLTHIPQALNKLLSL